MERTVYDLSTGELKVEEITQEEIDKINSLPVSPGALEAAQKFREDERRGAYATEADPLFFKAQRGEATMEEWQAKVAEIKERYPDLA